MLALFLITGAIVGGVFGEFVANWSLGGFAPYLVKTYPIFDLPPLVINLYVVKLVVGFTLQPSVMSIIGVVLAFILFRRF